MNTQSIAIIHPATPASLQANGKALEALLNSNEINDQQFLTLVQEREDLISQYLADSNEQQRRTFLEKEIPINEALTALAKDLRTATEKTLVKVVRGQKAVKRYL